MSDFYDGILTISRVLTAEGRKAWWEVIHLALARELEYVQWVDGGRRGE
jgi:hypothetical protein